MMAAIIHGDAPGVPNETFPLVDSEDAMLIAWPF